MHYSDFMDMMSSLGGFICLLLVLGNGRRVKSSEETGSVDVSPLLRDQGQGDIASNTTDLLNRLLQDYDRRLRPGFGGEPLMVDVNLNVRSIGPISELEMSFQIDLYFRQSWVDRRLAFSGSPLSGVQMSVTSLDRLWTPDTFFQNGRRSNLHTVTVPNKFLRLTRNGRILYSMRLTIAACCPMHLENFPLDTQSCPLHIGSHGYNENDVIYRWTDSSSSAIQLASDMTLSQFDLVEATQSNGTKVRLGGPLYSVLNANFILRRHMGYFVINVYVPSSILVVISWVGFWINREATADRIALGVTTVLTMAFLGIDNRRDLPKVSYSTALDYFVGVCFGFVMATILQFAGVHFFTKHDSGETDPGQDSKRRRNWRNEEEEDEEDEEDEEEAVEGEENEEDELHENRMSNETPIGAEDHLTWPKSKSSGFAGVRVTVRRPHVTRDSSSFSSPKGLQSPPKDDAAKHVHVQGNHFLLPRTLRRKFSLHHPSAAAAEFERPSPGGVLISVMACIFGDGAYSTQRTVTDGIEPINSVSRIDRVSRYLFPSAFAAFHVFYWVHYINKD